MNEVEAVARAIEDQLTAEDGWEVGTPALRNMCIDFAQAAIAALDAARGDAEPAMTTPEQIAAGISEDELLDEFRALFNWRGRKRLTAKQWAAEHGFSQAYVSDVLRGNRGIADRFAGEIGYQRVVIFVPATRNTGEEQ